MMDFLDPVRGCATIIAKRVVGRIEALRIAITLPDVLR